MVQCQQQSQLILAVQAQTVVLATVLAEHVQLRAVIVRPDADWEN